jgi:Flp pilus assembly protein TadG
VRGLLALARLHRAESGNASVEVAMSAGVLFLLVMGLMNMSQGVYTYHYVAEAAREGSRYAIVHGNVSGSIATPDSIQAYVRGLGYPGIKSSSMTVTTTWAGYPAGVVCAPSTSCNNPGNMATVKASYAFPVTIPMMGTKTLTMTSTSSMVISQ